MIETIIETHIKYKKIHKMEMIQEEKDNRKNYVRLINKLSLEDRRNFSLSRRYWKTKIQLMMCTNLSSQHAFTSGVWQR